MLVKLGVAIYNFKGSCLKNRPRCYLCWRFPPNFHIVICSRDIKCRSSESCHPVYDVEISLTVFLSSHHMRSKTEIGICSYTKSLATNPCHSSYHIISSAALMMSRPKCASAATLSASLQFPIILCRNSTNTLYIYYSLIIFFYIG